MRKLPKGQQSSNSLEEWSRFYKEIENAEYKDSCVLQKTIAFYIIKTTAMSQIIYSRQFTDKMKQIDMDIRKTKATYRFYINMIRKR